MNTLCFDVGGTAIKYAVFNKKGEILSKNLAATPEDKDSFLSEMYKIVEENKMLYAIDKISLSFPGYINPKSGFAETAGSIEYFTQTNILNEVEQALGSGYAFFIENDANCAAIAEKNSGHAKENESFLLLTIGTGLGGAIYIKDELLRGFQFKAGEFGRMRVQSDTDINSKLNNLISVRLLVQTYKKMKNMSVAENVSAKLILDESQYNTVVNDLVMEWIDNICISIFNVVTVINPEKVLIGGGVSAHPLFLNLVQNRMSRLDDWHEFEVPIETCKHFNDAGLIGAYYNSIG